MTKKINEQINENLAASKLAVVEGRKHAMDVGRGFHIHRFAVSGAPQGDAAHELLVRKNRPPAVLRGKACVTHETTQQEN